MPWWLAPALSVVGGMLSSRAQKGANDTDLVKLRNEANRSGFHPLTVLRATGGAGFTRGVHGGLSRMGALFSGASRMVGAYTSNQRQMVDDAYTAQFRAKQLRGMDQDYQIGKMTLSSMMNPTDEYEPYKQQGWVPVAYGDTMMKMDLSVARRFRIKPGDLIAPGEMTEIFGDTVGETIAALHTKGQIAVLAGDMSAWGILTARPPKQTVAEMVGRRRNQAAALANSATWSGMTDGYFSKLKLGQGLTLGY